MAGINSESGSLQKKNKTARQATRLVTSDETGRGEISLKKLTKSAN